MTESAVKVEVENLSEVKRKLSIEVPASEVTEEVDRAYRELGKQAKVKGFQPRQGAPVGPGDVLP